MLLRTEHYKGYEITAEGVGDRIVLTVTKNGVALAPSYSVDTMKNFDIQFYTGRSGLDHLLDLVRSDIDSGIITG